jgi:hypothetical protein
MPRILPPLAAFLFVAVAVGWLLISREDPAGPEDGVEPGRETPVAEGGPTLVAPPAPSPHPDGGAEQSGTMRTGPPSIDPRTLARGPLEVHVLDLDDQPVHSNEVTVDVGAAAGQPAWFDKPLLNPDPDGHVWKGDGFLAGPASVRVFGDHVLEQSVPVVIEKEPTPPVVVRVAWGGSVAYRATRLDGSEPAEVRVTLIGARKQPVLASYQVRTETVLTEPRRATEMVQGPRGLVFGVPPGTYTLRVVSPATDESDVREVTVEARKTTEVALRLAR